MNNSKYLPVIGVGLILCVLAGRPAVTAAQNSEHELFLVAQKAFEDGFYDVAMRYIQQLLQEYPQTEKRIQAHLLLGQCYFFKSQYLKAYDTFQHLLAYPEFKDATLFWLGETYLKGSDHKRAEEHYRQLIELYPQSVYTPQGYYSLGWLFLEQNQLPKAKEMFLNLIQKFPIHQLTEDAAFKLGEIEYNLHNYQNTIQHFKNYVLSYPKSARHAEAYFYTAEAYYYLNDFLTAVTYYAQAAEMAYDSKLILMAKVSLGWGYLKLGKLKLAEKNFEEARQFAQEKGILSDDVLLGQATLYSELKDYDRALEAYTQLAEKFPNSPRINETYLGQANIYYLRAQYPQAVRTYQTIIARLARNQEGIPPWPEAVEEREVIEKAYFGLAWAQLKSGAIDAAIKSFEAVKDKSPTQTAKISALTQIGDAYQDVDQLKKAIDIYDTILDDYPNSPYLDYVQYRQGIALLKLEKIEAATLSFQSLQANFPESKYLTDIKYYLAVAYFKKGDWKMAQEQINDFIDDLPQRDDFLGEAHYILALSHFNLQEYKKALGIFQKIIKDYPQQPAMVRNAELSIAKCYYKTGQIKEAIQQFNSLTAKYPQSQTAQESLIWLGDHYLEASAFDTAIAYYQQFIERFPGSEQLNSVYYTLGQAYQAKEAYDQAVNAFKHISDPAAGELYAKARLAIADIFSKELDPKSAIEIYQNIITTSPEFKRSASVKLAEIYKNDKEYAKAIEAYAQALKAKSNFSGVKDVELQFFLGDLYELANQKDQAVQEYLKMPYLYPKETPWLVKAYLRMARIFEDSEQWPEAEKVYNKIIELQTDELKFARERLEWIKENTVVSRY